MCVCLAQQRCVKFSDDHFFPPQTDTAVAAPSPWVAHIPWATEKAKCPAVMWCITKSWYGSSRMQISKKQLKISYMVGSSLQPQQSEDGLWAQQLLLATSMDSYPASLQASPVLHKVESLSRRTSEQLAAQGRWWEAGKEELLGDAGFMTAQQIGQGRMCMCVPHSTAMVSHHWGITGNLTWKQLEGWEGFQSCSAIAWGQCWGDHVSHAEY